MRRMPTTPHQRGFTLVELLVVIAIIGMLVALLIPAVSAARARMRKAACLNNMRQIGTALIAFESDKGRLPGYIEALKARGRDTKENGYVLWEGQNPTDPFIDSVYYNGGSGSTAGQSRIAWSAHILPQIDRGDIWEIVQGAEGSGAALLAQQTVPSIALYLCADDTDLTSLDNAAGISYSVNTGTWDWNGANYVGDTKANALFQNLSDGNVKSRLTDARDGSATTIMVAENMHKHKAYSWMGVQSMGSLATAGEQQLGITWVFDAAPDSGCGGRDEQYPFKDDGEVAYGSWAPAQPCFARPSSNHVGDSFNTVYADGHGSSVSVQIDYVVYQQLLAPHNSKVSDITGDSGSDAAIETFRTAPPLAESDFN